MNGLDNIGEYRFEDRINAAHMARNIARNEVRVAILHLKLVTFFERIERIGFQEDVEAIHSLVDMNGEIEDAGIYVDYIAVPL
jgi:hypothetical protein